MPTYIFDDVYGDQRPGSSSPTAVYEPQWGTWDPTCGTCWGCTLGTNLVVPIDSAKATMGTWHTVTVSDGHVPTNVSVTFTGTLLANSTQRMLLLNRYTFRPQEQVLMHIASSRLLPLPLALLPSSLSCWRTTKLII